MKKILLSFMITVAAIATEAQTRVVIRPRHRVVAVSRFAVVRPAVVAQPVVVPGPIIAARPVVVRPVRRRVVIVH